MNEYVVLRVTPNGRRDVMYLSFIRENALGWLRYYRSIDHTNKYILEVNKK